jgi:hypothetical protein
MLLRPEYLSQKLDRAPPTKDGGTLRIIGEACTYMTSMDKKRGLRTHWQRACKLKANVLTVSRALELDAAYEVASPHCSPPRRAPAARDALGVPLPIFRVLAPG